MHCPRLERLESLECLELEATKNAFNPVSHPRLEPQIGYCETLNQLRTINFATYIGDGIALLVSHTWLRSHLDLLAGYSAQTSHSHIQ